MKTSNENQKGWLGRLSMTLALVASLQVFVACGGGGGGGSPAPVALPVGVGVGTFNAANCTAATGGIFSACAIGSSPAYGYLPGFEVLLQATSTQAVGVGGYGTGYGYGGINSYSGPVQVSGVVNVQAGASGCLAASTYSFTGTLNYYGTYLNNFEGTVTATGGTGQMTILFADPFLTAGGGVSSTGQSFAYRLVGQIQIMSVNTGIGYGGIQQACGIPSGGYVLN